MAQNNMVQHDAGKVRNGMVQHDLQQRGEVRFSAVCDTAQYSAK